MSAYVIESNGLYWSSTYGWTELDDADLFTYEERMNLNLPIGGAWAYVEW